MTRNPFGVLATNMRYVLATALLCSAALHARPGLAGDKTFTGMMSNDWQEDNNWNPTGKPGVSDNVFININKTADLSGANATVTNLTLGGTLTGSGTVTVNGMLSWGSGIMSGSGVTNADGGMTIHGSSHTLNARTLNNG